MHGRTQGRLLACQRLTLGVKTSSRRALRGNQSVFEGDTSVGLVIGWKPLYLQTGTPSMSEPHVLPRRGIKENKAHLEEPVLDPLASVLQ